MNIEPSTDQSTLFPEWEVHVWRTSLHVPLDAGADVFACLSPGERARLERVRGTPAARQFALTRLALRHILSRYTGVAADAVALTVDARGKPALAGGALHFSLSHAARVSCIAVAHSAVGIDIEHIREPRRLLRVAERVLHARTVAALRNLSGTPRTVGFLDAWTQREAHVKAVGRGLLMTADTLPADVTQPADGAPRLQHDEERGDAWSVVRLAAAADTRGSVVAHGTIRRVRYFEWTLPESGTEES